MRSLATKKIAYSDLENAFAALLLSYPGIHSEYQNLFSFKNLNRHLSNKNNKFDCRFFFKYYALLNVTK